MIAILARSLNNVIGVDGKLPWHLPEDLKFFKEITKGKTIVMGRKTYNSIGKPLKFRNNIILSKDSNLHIDGCEVINSFGEVSNLSNPIIIGGKALYDYFIPKCDIVYCTIVNKNIPCNSDCISVDYNFDSDIWDAKIIKQGISSNGLGYQILQYTSTRTPL